MRRAILAVFMLTALTSTAMAVTVVPEGNRFEKQPHVPGASTRRTQAGGSSFEAKYRKAYRLFEKDKELVSKVRSVARSYGIDPIHIVGAIVGEHTYNVDAYDRLQTYYVKAAAYLTNTINFSYAGESAETFLQRPQFSKCDPKEDSYDLWTCREQVWNSAFKGKSVDGKKFPNDRFSATFFQPLYAGQTFGLGQMNPLTALQMSDMVSAISGYPKLDYREPQKVYETIMDPDRTLPYVAAVLRKSIDAYKAIAGFDISKNPGITSTLYNVGNPEARARALAHENQERKERGEAPRLPEENYYGWLVNDRIAELEKLL
nr:DUF1402 family protein [Limoniibacter endophyticus]